jgi:ABC-type lipopolysaccharide export system ATPase subunit
MEISGKIKLINPTNQVSESFKKRELVVTTEEQYQQHILIEFIQDKCSILDSYNVGENVRVSINVRGKEHTNKEGETKYYNQLQGWKIERTDSAVPPQYR